MTTTEISKSDLFDSIDQTLVLSIARGLTIIAVNNNQLCGVIANNWSVVDRSHSQEVKIKRDYGNDLDQDNSFPSKIRYIDVMLKQLETFVPNFLPTDCHQCFRIDLVSVKPKFAGCGIGKRLFLESFKLAKRLGFQFCETVCTATASTKIALSVGMKIAFVFPYSKYVSHSLTVFPNPMHDGCEGASLLIGDVNEVLQES
ncbi:Acetyltransferase, GNAT family [Aphelenchoides besseyi]|nr:Acetyltransferase, GNAT family [Aphelenchoides besseyi]KAI6199963.1 Acetyltransferase, GNAT family [Aphelenchoides besseyi]